MFTIGGYQKRGNPIFGFTNMDQFVADDKKRFTTLGYFTGPGAPVGTGRKEPTTAEVNDSEFKWQSLVPVLEETHGAEDVGKSLLLKQNNIISCNYLYYFISYSFYFHLISRNICVIVFN